MPGPSLRPGPLHPGPLPAGPLPSGPSTPGLGSRERSGLRPGIRRLGWGLFYGALVWSLLLGSRPAWAQSHVVWVQPQVESTDRSDDRSDAAAGHLVGTVRDSMTGDPLIGANVALLDDPQTMENQRGTATGSDGRFELTRVAPGTYTLQVTYVGYERSRARVKIVPGDRTRHVAALPPENLEMEEVRVSASTHTRRTSRNIGVSRMSIEEITRMPTPFAPDVFRALRKLPGVGGQSDLSSGLYIRGGSPGQTLVELDGATIYNPSHFLGFFSTFNPDAIDGATLHKGAYPASYGGRLGAVVDLTHRNPSRRPGGSVSVGLLSSRLSFEGPHPRGSWMVTARRSTMEPVLAELNERDVDGVPESFRFFDVNAAARIRLSESDRLDASLYRGGDRMEFPFAANMVFDLAYGNRAGSLTWTHVPSERFMGRVRLTGADYWSDSRATLTRAPFGRENAIRDLGLSASVDYVLSGTHEWSAGIEANAYRFDILDTHNYQTELDRTQRPARIAAYAQETWTPDERWTLQLGVRGTHFAYAGPEGARSKSYVRATPRLSAEYRPAGRIRLQLGAGRYHQFLALDAASLLSSFHTWLPAGRNVAPAWGDQLTAGVKTDLTDGLHLDVEGYVRTMHELFELDPRRSDAGRRSYADLFHTGEGLAFGVETLLERRSGRLTGHLAYTWGKTGRRFPDVNGGRWYPTTYDRRHDLHLALSFRIADRWALSTTVHYASGQPYTKPTSQYILYDSPYMGHNHDVFRAPRNNARLPAYRRVDAGLTRTGRLFGQADYEMRLQVVNALSRRNAWFNVYSYDENYAIQEQATPQIPVPLPSLTFRASF